MRAQTSIHDGFKVPSSAAWKLSRACCSCVVQRRASRGCNKPRSSNDPALAPLPSAVGLRRSCPFICSMPRCITKPAGPRTCAGSYCWDRRLLPGEPFDSKSKSSLLLSGVRWLFDYRLRHAASTRPACAKLRVLLHRAARAELAGAS